LFQQGGQNREGIDVPQRGLDWRVNGQGARNKLARSSGDAESHDRILIGSEPLEPIQAGLREGGCSLTGEPCRPKPEDGIARARGLIQKEFIQLPGTKQGPKGGHSGITSFRFGK
jgi:hypothetical protein